MGEENNNKINIQIDGGIIFTGLVYIGIAFLLYYLRDVVLGILAAIIISAAIDPAVRFVERRRIPRAFGVIGVYLFLAIVVASVLLFIIPTFLFEISEVVDNIPKYISQVGNIIPLLDESILQGYIPLIQQISDQISNIALAKTGGSGGIIGGDILSLAKQAISGSVDVIIIVVLSFYFSVTKDGVEHFLRIIIPNKYESYILNLWGRSKKKMGGWLQGQLILAVLVGTLLYPVLAILGVKHAFLLAIFAAIMELIPVFGPVLSAVPAILVALLDGGATVAIMVAGYYLIVQQFENHIFYPLVVKKIIGISPLVVIIALVVGAKLAGILGIILSVPLSVILVEYLEDIDKRKKIAREG